MKRLIAFVLALFMLLPAGALAEPAENETLTAGAYVDPTSGDYLWLFETETGIRAGYLVQQVENGAYFHGVSWTENSLTIEKTSVDYEYRSDILHFAFYNREHYLMYDPSRPTRIGYEDHAAAIDLGGKTLRAANGTVAAFHADGTGTVTLPGAEPAPLIWGFIPLTTYEGSNVIVTDSFLSGAELENGVLTFRTDDSTEIKVSAVTRTDITGTEVISPEYNFRVILSDPNWEWAKEDELYSFKRSNNLAFIYLYDFETDGTEITTEQFDGALDELISRVGGTANGTYYDQPVAGLRGRRADFTYNANGMDFSCSEIIFAADRFAYYLTVMEPGEYSEDTLQVLSDIVDTFRFAE